MKTKQTVVKCEAVDDGVGGFHYSYGAGVAGTDYDVAIIGCGRSAAEAADDAAEQLATMHDIDVEGWEAIHEAIAKLPGDETEVQGWELDIANECAMERFGKPYSDCSRDERVRAEDAVLNGDPIEHAAVLFVKFGAADALADAQGGDR